jgi:hypothetical protein
VTRLEILRAEYQRAYSQPLFDKPSEYCVILDLIMDEIEKERENV